MILLDCNQRYRKHDVARLHLIFQNKFLKNKLIDKHPIIFPDDRGGILLGGFSRIKIRKELTS